MTKSSVAGRRPVPSEHAWTVEAVRQLGLSTTIDTAASIIGISRTKAYTLAKSGQFPVRLIRVGRRYLVPTTALIDLMASESIRQTTVDDKV